MSGRAATALPEWFEASRAWADRALDELVPCEDAHPAELHRAMRYALFGGGKRLRPALVRLFCHAFGGSDAQATRPAAALELIHTYSLVHDDLPCMDDDDLRRGRPTCHVEFGEATAVLVGDALQALAFEVLASGAASDAAAVSALVVALATAAGGSGMVGGQVLDLSLEVGAEKTLPAIVDMHARKTAALFGAACEMGAIAAGATADERAGALRFGRALGLAFQAVDDLLDVTGDAGTLGKTPGKDAALERATLVATVGLEQGRARARELAQEARDSLAALGWSNDSGARREAGVLAAELVEFVLERRA